MKKLITALTLMLLLTGCGKTEPEVESYDASIPSLEHPTDVPPTEVEPIEEVEPKTPVYEVKDGESKTLYFGVVGCLQPLAHTDDLELYRDLDTITCFRLDTTDIFLGRNAAPTVPDLNIMDVGEYVLATRDHSFNLKTLTDAYVETIANLDDYTVLPTVPTEVSDDALATMYSVSIAGYDAPDIFNYAIVELQDGTVGAVCYKDYGDIVDYVILGLDVYTCDILNETTLLIEETGEELTLEFKVNPDYGIETEE